jgi:hypothetical protein
MYSNQRLKYTTSIIFFPALTEESMGSQEHCMCASLFCDPKENVICLGL